MKIRSLNNYIICLYTLILLLGSFNDSIPFYETNEKVNFEENLSENFQNKLRSSSYWVVSPINIDGTAVGVGAQNWTWAESQAWCQGAGNWTDPYIIENVTIDVGAYGSGISIVNSSSYFIIKNSTIFNSGTEYLDAGIILSNTSNGKIINNTVISNSQGILLEYCSNNIIIGNNISNNYNSAVYINQGLNNTISMNILNNNVYYGVVLWYSNLTNIIDNNMSLNLYGMYLYSCINSTITSNNVSNNKETGVRLWLSHYNTIVNNTVNQNNGISWFSGRGIYLVLSKNNTLSNNTIERNSRYGIYLSSSPNNTLNGNI